MAHLNHAHTTYDGHRINTAKSFEKELLQESVLWKLLLLTAIAYLVWSEKISIVFGPVASETIAQQPSEERGIKASLFGFSTEHPQRSQTTGIVLPPGKLNNVTLAIDPDYANRNGLESDEAKARLAKCQDYVGRFAPVAIAEMRRYGIPASIILAQGLLESNAGDSKLARGTNNHFGIKCFSKRCKKGHCLNFTDDSHKDFFVKYDNAWGSFRAHSTFLKTTQRYAPLFNLDKNDYRAWARGLVKAGYATDKKYADKLIAVIQTLDLNRYDKL